MPTTQPPQTGNQMNSPYANLNYQEPPSITLVEASCELAEVRSEDNSEWENVLKDTIFVPKGAEIRCASTFLDMKGVDNEIIQFESSGAAQDNCHTLLTNIYTVNDGFNGKTSSYDYICRPQTDHPNTITGANAFNNGLTVEIVDTGSNLTSGAHRFKNVISQVVTDLEYNLVVSANHFTLGSLTITNFGDGYRTGDALIFNYNSGGGQQQLEAARGYVICNDLGQVRNYVLESRGQWSHNPPTSGNLTGITVSVSSDSGGRNATFTPVITGNESCGSISLAANSSDVLVEWDGDPTSNVGLYQAQTTPGGVDTNFTIRVLSALPPIANAATPGPATSARASLTNKVMFDQGYNYQKAPLYRYCQTFDWNPNFTFGNHFLDRSFTTGAGNPVQMYERPAQLLEDVALSAYNSIKRREDEFCPGIFHNDGIVNNTPFLLNSATTKLGHSNQNQLWRLGWEDGLCCIWAPDIFESKTVNSNQYNLESNILNRFPVGCPLSITTQGDHDYNTYTQAQVKWGLYNIHRYWGGVFQVGKNEYIVGGPPITFPTDDAGNTSTYTNYRKITLGSPRMFLNTLQPTGQAFYLDYNNATGQPDNFIANPNTSHLLDAVNVKNDAGNTMTGAGCQMTFNFDGAGVWQSFTLTSRGSGYKKGDIVKFLNPDGTDNRVLFYITQVDNIADFNRGSNGTTFAAPQGTHLDRLNLIDGATGNTYALFLNPLPFYNSGLGDINNPNANFPDNPNSICCIRQIERTAGVHFNNYPNFPPTFSELGINPSDTLTTDDFTNKSAFVGLYKNNGEVSGTLNRNNLNADFSSHSVINYDSNGAVSEKTSLTTLTNVWLEAGFPTYQFTCDTTANNGEVSPIAPTDTFILLQKARLETLLGGAFYYNAPTNYVVMTFTNNLVDYEEHLLFNNFEEVILDGNNYIKFFLRARNIHQNQFYNFFTNDPDMNGAYGNYTPSGDTGFGFKLENQPQAVVQGDVISLKYIQNEAQYYNFLTCSYDPDGIGDIPFTSTTNFYNTSDPNYQTLNTIPVWKNILTNNEEITPSTLNSYNNGGHYFLTHNNGYLNNIANTNPSQIAYSKNYGFSQGFNEFLLTNRIRSIEYESAYPQDNYYPTQSTFVNQLETNATNVFGYELLYKQKTFKIDRDFAIPSDIGGFWTRQSHDLTGIQDILTGQQLTTPDDCGILQNEFIFPIFGSNNQIDGRGRYIKDKITYPDSNGLEPGHVIGKLYVDSFSEYLNTEVKYSLPEGPDQIKFANIFFRTFFTQVRNYDPLKGVSTGNPPTYNGEPDRTPFETIHTKAGLIGNLTFRNGYVKAIPASGGNPAVPGQAGTVVPKYTLDGHLLQDSTSQGPGGAGDVDTFATEMYELGTPAPGVANIPGFFPHTSTEYPVRYINNDGNDTYGRAKISSFVGSTNMTLAYQTDLSTFAFEYFFTPYTSPYVDDSGGDISTRVFYGNRPKGLYNHDSLGGVNVFNWCRPDFPRGIMTYREVRDNIKSSDYPNGINPLSGVATIGQAFLNKLGFTNNDLSIEKQSGTNNFIVNVNSGNIGISFDPYVEQLRLDNNYVFPFYSSNLKLLKTNQARLDSSASILSAIPAPETNPGLNSHIASINPTHGQSIPVVNRWGDYIFYPYSINSSTNTFNSSGSGTVADPAEASRVRWDNATDTYASVGGLNLTEAGRGMGTPNTTGSTTICNPTTIPVTLNPDCNIYLSYTVQSDSDYILASSLPRKLNHGHLIVVSDLLDKPSYHLSQAGAINGISIVNKTFITGDFILSMGQLSFYAQEDRFISRIKTKIVNSSFNAPTTLGSKSTVIYQIINQNPTPAQAPIPAVVQQQRDYAMMEMIAQHQQSNQQGTPSRLADLHNKLYQIGISTLIDPLNNNMTVVNQLEQYVEGYDLAGMTPAQRQDFYRTPEGGAFLQTATNFTQLRGLMEEMDASTDPQIQAQLQDRLALQLRAINRGADLPPVPMAPETENEPFDFRDPEFLTQLGYDPNDPNLQNLLDVDYGEIGSPNLNDLMSDWGGNIIPYLQHLRDSGALAGGQNLQPPIIPAGGGAAVARGGGVGPESGIGTSIASTSVAGGSTAGESGLGGEEETRPDTP